MKTGRWLWGDETESSPIRDTALTEPGSDCSPHSQSAALRGSREDTGFSSSHLEQALGGRLAEVMGVGIDGRNLRLWVFKEGFPKDEKRAAGRCRGRTREGPGDTDVQSWHLQFLLICEQ